MRYIPLIYILLLSVYNIWGNNDNVLWVIFYYVVIHSVMGLLFFGMAMKSVIKKERNLYRVGGIFSCLYVLFHVVVLAGWRSEFVNIIDSKLWSLIGVVVSVIILTTFYYDKRARDSIS